MRLTPSCVAVFLSLCFDSFEYRPNACKTSSVVIGVVRIFAKCQRIVYFFANIPAEPGSSLQQRGFLCDLRRREARYQKSDALTESSLPHMECCRLEDCLIASHQGPSDTYPYVYAKDARQFSRSVRLRRRASRLSRVHGCLVPWHFPWDACQATNFFIRPLLWAVPTSSPTRPFTGGPAHAALNGFRKNIEFSDNNRYS
jgi:hypothetical protein